MLLQTFTQVLSQNILLVKSNILLIFSRRKRSIKNWYSCEISFQASSGGEHIHDQGSKQ